MGVIGHIRRSLSFQRTLSVKIIVGCSLALITALGVSFTVIAVRQERLIMEQVEREARILFSQIVVTRSWIADHGGIFIEKLPSMEASPYIRESEIVDLKGKRYIRKTPAMVTKDLAVYARERGLYWFHITSLTLTNPANAPDAFERKALEKFSLRQGEEVIAVETMGDGQVLRYIAPLFVEEACMKCHSHQGYRVGDVRGAIGIVIPIEKTIAAIDSNRKGMIVAGLLTLITLVGALYLMLRALVLSPLGRLKESIQGFPEGRYSPDAALRTGDELEDLSNAFARMADTLTDYHSCLNDRIRAATGNLEAVNRKLVETNNLLQEVSARKSDCIARASHELRSPLTSIKGAMDYIAARLSVLLRDNPDYASLADLGTFFDVIKKNTERLIRMVNDMLDLERIEMGTSDFRFSDTDLPGLITETLTSFSVSAGDKGVAFVHHLPDELTVRADEDRIRQVLANLLTNALRYSPAGSSVTFSARSEGSFAVTEVRDEGPGIPPGLRERIFEKFYKGGSREGSGLGLAICRSIIEAHGGKIGVASNGEKGSCFHFTIPLAGHHAEAPVQEQSGETFPEQDPGPASSPDAAPSCSRALMTGRDAGGRT